MLVFVKKKKKKIRKNARSRSVRLQRGTAHIQRSTERRVSVVVGRTWLCLSAFWRGSHRHASSSFVSVQTRTAQSWQDLDRTPVLNSVGNDFLETNWQSILGIQRQSIVFYWFLIYNTQSTKKVIAWLTTSHQTTTERIVYQSTVGVIVDWLLMVNAQSTATVTSGRSTSKENRSKFNHYDRTARVIVAI